MRELIPSPATEDDILAAALWYEARSAGLGMDFIRAADAALAAVARSPHQYPVVHRKVRRVLMRRFPYAAYFVTDDRTVQVIACMHVRRDPRRWKARVNR
ncbi:MAG: type II toxin-antitoxin system RelE/ParE family toxin [Coriobacteriia bacterium]|nr:type II toxin-antitoxin system RelE/ParE family toxin [Coriobacteriia bacterium]